MTSYPESLGSLWGNIKLEDVTEDMIDQVLGMKVLPFTPARFDPILWHGRELELNANEGEAHEQDGSLKLFQLFLDSASPFFASPYPKGQEWWPSRDLFKVIESKYTGETLYVYESRMLAITLSWSTFGAH